MACYATHESWATLHTPLPEFKETFIMPYELYPHPLRNVIQHTSFLMNLDKEKPFRQTHTGAQAAQSQQMQVKTLGLHQEWGMFEASPWCMRACVWIQCNSDILLLVTASHKMSDVRETEHPRCYVTSWIHRKKSSFHHYRETRCHHPWKSLACWSARLYHQTWTSSHFTPLISKICPWWLTGDPLTDGTTGTTSSLEDLRLDLSAQWNPFFVYPSQCSVRAQGQSWDGMPGAQRVKWPWSRAQQRQFGETVALKPQPPGQ